MLWLYSTTLQIRPPRVCVLEPFFHPAGYLSPIFAVYIHMTVSRAQRRHRLMISEGDGLVREDRRERMSHREKQTPNVVIYIHSTFPK